MYRYMYILIHLYGCIFSVQAKYCTTNLQNVHQYICMHGMKMMKCYFHNCTCSSTTKYTGCKSSEIICLNTISIFEALSNNWTTQSDAETQRRATPCTKYFSLPPKHIAIWSKMPQGIWLTAKFQLSASCITYSKSTEMLEISIEPFTHPIIGDIQRMISEPR